LPQTQDYPSTAGRHRPGTVGTFVRQYGARALQSVRVQRSRWGNRPTQGGGRLLYPSARSGPPANTAAGVADAPSALDGRPYRQ